MRISLLSCSEQPFNYFTELEVALKKEIIDAEIDTYFVHSVLDLPLKAKTLSEDAELILVSYVYEKDTVEPNHIAIVLNKLIQIELETETVILKGLEPLSKEGALTEEDVDEEKEKYVKKWKDAIITFLVAPEKFNPEYEESLETPQEEEDEFKSGEEEYTSSDEFTSDEHEFRSHKK